LTTSCSSLPRRRSPNRLQEFSGFSKRFEPCKALQSFFWTATEGSHDAPDDVCHCGYRLDYRSNLCAAAASAFDSTIDCRDAVVGGVPYDSRRKLSVQDIEDQSLIYPTGTKR
jgi:hypothetical protein